MKMTILFAADNEVSCTAAARAASKLKANRNLLITIDASPDSQSSHCLRQLASSARYRFDLNNLEGFYPVFEPIRNDDLLGSNLKLDDRIFISLRQVSVIETLSDGFQYVPGSAEPVAEISPDGRQLSWDFNYLPSMGVTLTYRVHALSPGFHEVSKGTDLTWKDIRNQPGKSRLAPGRVLVIGKVE